MKNILVALFCLILGGTFAQNMKNYNGIESAGPMPNDLIIHSSDKFASSLDKEINANDKRSERKAKKRFLLQSSFRLRDFLYSGKVLYNDTLSNYVNQVSDKLLENHPLKDSIRFYVVKSSAVNGFATNDGMIFITLGLISQIENEAQLAYILAHEISHYRKKHVINSYVENSKLERARTNFRVSSNEDLALKKNKYSRELETEADTDGYKLFYQSNYKKEGVERVFDVLKYSYLPFDEVQFDTTMFQDGYYKFPTDYWSEEINGIAIDDDYNEEKSSHPSPDRRKEKILRAIQKSKPQKDSKVYLIKDKRYFEYMREVARFEISKVLLYEREYEEAIYHNFLLKKKHKDNSYLDHMMTLALYYEFRSNLENNYSYFRSSSIQNQTLELSEVEGESYQVYYWLSQLPNKELGVLVLKNALENQIKYPDNNAFEKIVFDAMYLLSRDYQISFTSFENSYPTSEVTNDSLTEEIIDEDNLSKVDKIRLANSNYYEDDYSEYDYYRFALVNVMKQHDDLEEVFDQATKLADKSIKYHDDQVFKLGDPKEQKRIKREGHAFGIEKLVMVDPNYTKVNEKKDQALLYNSSESALKKLHSDMQKTAKDAGLQLDILDNLSLGVNDTKKFNDLALLNSWMSHSSSFLEKTDTNFFVSIDNERVNELVNKYNSSYYCWSGFTGIHEKKSGKAIALCASALYVVTLPIGIYYAVTPEYNTNFYLIVFNVKDNKLVWLKTDDLDDRDSDSIIKSILYDSFKQINNERK